MAESTKTLVRDVRKTANANATTVVDSLPLIAFKVLEYTVSYSTGIPFRLKRLKFLVHKTDTNLATEVYAKSGDLLNIGIDAFINGDFAEVRLNNLENYAVEFIAARTII